jgi:hypothetical protein
MTGVLPVSGVGARIAGSTPAGGHMTPSDLANLSPKGSRLWPTVLSCGVVVPGTGCIGAQSREGGAAWIDGFGGACATAAPHSAIHTQQSVSESFILMKGKRSDGADVPRPN